VRLMSSYTARTSALASAYSISFTVDIASSSFATAADSARAGHAGVSGPSPSTACAARAARLTESDDPLAQP
jgi:hypothetical protein